jgi:hypothetical protein
VKKMNDNFWRYHSYASDISKNNQTNHFATILRKMAYREQFDQFVRLLCNACELDPAVITEIGACWNQIKWPVVVSPAASPVASPVGGAVAAAPTKGKLTGYTYFVKVRTAEKKISHPAESPTDRRVAVNAEWKVLNATEKAEWTTQAQMQSPVAASPVAAAAAVAAPKTKAKAKSAPKAAAATDAPKVPKKPTGYGLFGAALRPHIKQNYPKENSISLVASFWKLVSDAEKAQWKTAAETTGEPLPVNFASMDRKRKGEPEPEPEPEVAPKEEGEDEQVEEEDPVEEETD